MKNINFNIAWGRLITIGRFKILFGMEPKNKEQLNKVDECICERNAKGQMISGWCKKHNTDWV